MARRKQLPARKLREARRRVPQGPSNSWSWSSRGPVFTTRRSCRLLVQAQSTKKKHDEVIATSNIIGTGVASSASSSRIIDSQARPLLICTSEVTSPIHDDPYIKFEGYTPGNRAEFTRGKKTYKICLGKISCTMDLNGATDDEGSLPVLSEREIRMKVNELRLLSRGSYLWAISAWTIDDEEEDDDDDDEDDDDDDDDAYLYEFVVKDVYYMQFGCLSSV